MLYVAFAFDANHMEQGTSGEANSNSASQEIPSLLWDQPSPGFHLSQVNPVNTFPTCLPEVHFNIIFLSTLRFSECPVLFRFSDQNFVHMTPISYPWFVHPDNI
jgi:hypothetical protein